MRFPNKKYILSDKRKVTVAVEQDPTTNNALLYLDIDGAKMINFGFTGLDFTMIGQQPIGADEFLLDTVAYPWAEEWLHENKLAEPTGEKRTWLENPRYAFDTGNLENWEKSNNPTSGIRKKKFPVYRLIWSTIREGQ